MDDRNIFDDQSWHAPEYNYPFDTPVVKEAKKTFSRYNLALFLYTAVAYAVIFAVTFILRFTLSESVLTEISGSLWYQWLMGVGPMYLVGFPVLLFIVRNMPKTKRLQKKLSFTEFAGLFLVGQAFMFLGNIIGTSLNGVIGAILGHEIGNATSELIEASPIWLIILVVVIIGPIIEELLFRKFMIDRFAKYGDALAIIFSAVAFGLFHGNFYQFFYAALLGLVLGYIYTKTGNIYYTIIMHMLVNFLGSVAVMPIIEMQELVLSLMESANIEETLKGNIHALYRAIMAVYSYSIVQYTMVVSGFVIFYKAIKERKISVNKYPEVKIPKGRVAEAVLLNVGTILFLVLSLALFAVSIFLG